MLNSSTCPGSRRGLDAVAWAVLGCAEAGAWAPRSQQLSQLQSSGRGLGALAWAPGRQLSFRLASRLAALGDRLRFGSGLADIVFA